MQRGKTRVGLWAKTILTLCLLAALLPAVRAQTPAEVQHALDEARKGITEPILRLQQRYGDKALSSFAAARFDKDEMVRQGTLEAAGGSLESAVFILPLIEDDNVETARLAISILDSFSVLHRETFRKLSAEQTLAHIAVALKKHPELLHRARSLPLLLSQFQNNLTARRLLITVLRANNWEDLLGRDKPAQWDIQTLGALLAQCETGRYTPAQVTPVLNVNPGARLQLLSYIGYISNKTILRYAISLLYDTTWKRPIGGDIPGGEICSEAQLAFNIATKLGIKRIEVKGVPQYDQNGVPLYDKEDIARLYAYYGLTEK